MESYEKYLAKNPIVIDNVKPLSNPSNIKRDQGS